MRCFLLATTALLTACTMAPNYVQPELPVAQSWPEESAPPAAATADQALAAQVQWRDFFKSPPLQAVIEQALANNRDLRVAALNIESARAQYRVTRADLMPTVRAELTGNRQNMPVRASQNGGVFNVKQYNARLANTAYEIDLFGRLQSLNEAALESYLATEEARNATQITLIAETANAYLQWLADQKTLALVNQTLEAQTRNHDIIKASYEKGIRSKLDLAQAQTTVENARANQALYERTVAQDKNALLVLIGTKQADVLNTPDTLDTVVLMDNLPVGVPSQVLLARPDIQQAEHQLKARNANIGAARAAFFPTISLTGSYGFSSTALSSLFTNGASGAWTFAPQITLPIFDGGRNLANLDAAETEEQIAAANYEKAIQVAFREVSDELIARKTLGTQWEAQRELLKAAQSAYDLSNARYKSGIENFLTVLDSQQSLFAAQQNEIAVHREQLSNLVNLYKVLGGGATN